MGAAHSQPPEASLSEAQYAPPEARNGASNSARMHRSDLNADGRTR